MKFFGDFCRYGRIEIILDEKAERIEVTAPSGKKHTVYSFKHQPIELTYDHEGFEKTKTVTAPITVARFTPHEPGKYVFEAYSGENMIDSDTLCVLDSARHGYVEVSSNDKRYFTYSDGEPFFWVGINLCSPTPYEVSSGTEFALSGSVAYIGLAQYERWMKKCKENGVNVIRIWLGHDYWSPDTVNTYELDAVKLSKIDALVSLARKHGLKLKFTIEQFRHFIYDKKSAFNKQLYHNGKPCLSSGQWLTDEGYVEAWMYKIGELAKRYSGDTEVAMIELWNEMNCVGGGYPLILEWNEKILPRVKALFPHQLVTNSLGSLDSDRSAKCYKDFCWDKTDVLQIHRYLDQGASYKICGESPVESVLEVFDFMRTDEMPMLLAETGAVNDCHSGEFRYYSADDRGIIFVDCVYTPLFVGSGGCGNIWHWDRRYVESKMLYRFFKPLSDLVQGVEFDREGFDPVDLSTDKAYILALKGRRTTLVFVRNKSDNWMNTLRDMNEPSPIDVEIDCVGNTVKLYNIWDEEKAEYSVEKGKLYAKGLRYGVMIKMF